MGIQKIKIIAINTFRESIRSKVLYSLFLFAALIIGASALFGSVTIGDHIKVIKDFGLFSISLFSVAFAVISGSTLLHKELSRKTVFNILSKSVRRSEFLTGKLLGMYITTVMMISLMGIGFSGFVYLFEGKLDLALFQGYLHIMLELFIICSAVIFFSAIVVTPMLIGIFSFGLFLTGRSLNLLLYFIEEGVVSGFEATLVKALYWGLPQLNSLQISNAIVHGDTISLLQTGTAALYAFTYGVILLLIGQQLFRNREFN